MRLGSLFSGIGGLDLAVAEHYGATHAWCSELDPNAARVLAAHFPEVPNLGDITAVDWTAVEPIEVLCGGFPCQDISTAGKGAGIKEGTRSGLWFVMAEAVRVLRPHHVVVENVGALVVRGLDTVVGDLAALGYDATWRCVRASDVGAPHRRERLFLVAHPADADGAPRRLAGSAGQAVRQPGAIERPGRRGRMGDDGPPAPDADSRRLPGWPQQHGQPQDAQPEGADRRHADRLGMADRWGRYAPAIARWEATIGRAAPGPTDGRGRLHAPFVEWMMGLPDGWVCDHLDRRPALKALGNAVVPQQAAHALRLLERMAVAS